MKVFTQFVVAFLFATQAIAQVNTLENGTPNTWTQKADFAGNYRSNAVAFSIGSKGYLGTGNNGNGYATKDFWEYDPSINVWTQKADFGGAARYSAVGFSIEGKGYLGTGYSFISPKFYYFKDFWEYDPAANAWTEKADFGGTGRLSAVGFSIGQKGYIGTGNDGSYKNDFWEYNPATNIWARKADFKGTARHLAVGFSISNKGYIGTGTSGYYPNFIYYKDFWEYNPVANNWTQKADFGGTGRLSAVGFSTTEKGYISTGGDYSGNWNKDSWEYNPVTNIWTQKADFGGGNCARGAGFTISNKGYIEAGYDTIGARKDFWEYTPDDATVSCPTPSGLVIDSVTSTAARLGWDSPSSAVNGFQLRYRPAGTALMRERLIKPTSTHVILRNLEPNTTYKWRIRSVCSNEFSDWAHGPDFTTTSAIALSSGEAAKGSSLTVNSHVQIMPNPSKGNFTIHMQLPAKDALTTLALYNSLGERVWQQQAGMLSGSVTKSIALDNKLSSGVYILRIERSDIRLMQKVVVTK